MTEQDLRALWTPPPRPEWVAKVNAEAECMDIRHVVPLDEDSLLTSARAATGLSDFGDDSWRPHFARVMRSIEEDADYNLLGRISARAFLLNVLQGRLMIEETYRQHPEIENEVVEAPIFVIGQPRSGTSALQNLLASDPGNGFLATWEAMLPVPPPETATYHSDPRIQEADRLVRQWARIVPETAGIHEFSGTIPAECVQITSYEFLSKWFLCIGQLTGYAEYMITADWASAYAYHKRVLKLLQWRNPRAHWVLKAPTHLQHLPELLDAYPDAQLVWPHRDPVTTAASLINLAGMQNFISSDRPRVSWDQQTEPKHAAAIVDRAIDWIEDGTVPRERICSVLYDDLISDPIGTAETIYRHFGTELTPQRRLGLERYVAENPRSARPAHRYITRSGAGMDRDHEIFRRYIEYFNVPLAD